LADPTKYDGVCPKNAVCTHCGYHIGGVPIKDGCIICPECGESVPFAFAPVVRSRTHLMLLPFVTAALLGLTLGGTLWGVGFSVGVSVTVALGVLLLLVPISLARVLRTTR
jgi:hypothetical protein